MKKVISIIFSLLALNCWAIDQYDGTYLSIPQVNAFGKTYTGVVITIESVKSVNNVNLGLSIDSFDDKSNLLSIPQVTVGSLTYSNVIVKIGKVISVGGMLNDVPFMGNSFITTQDPQNISYVEYQFNSKTSISNWNSPKTVISTFVYVTQPGQLEIGLTGNVPSGGNSQIKVSVLGQSFTIQISGVSIQRYQIGSVFIAKPGYIQIDLQGLSKNTLTYGDITSLNFSGVASTNLKYVSKDNIDPSLGYYWMRRGPSVDVYYTLPPRTNYFYNEVTVPIGYDPKYTYYCASSFNSAYLGIQVTGTESITNKLILFSMWNPSDQLCANDSNQCTKVIKKGSGVIDKTFSGEGTGAQTILNYPWVTGTTLRFITKSTFVGQDTRLTSWFYDPTKDKWFLIATFNYPGKNIYLTNGGSFLESFDPSNFHPKKMLLSNQWTSSDGVNWQELNSAQIGAMPSIEGLLNYSFGLSSISESMTPRSAFFLQSGFFDSGGLSYNSEKSGITIKREASGTLSSYILARILANLPQD